MTTADRAQLVADLERDEGCELLPYTDTVDKLTVGIGRNLTDRGISLEEAHYLLQRDIDLVVADLDRALPWWREMTPARQRVLANMCFIPAAAAR